ncbi:MAG: precorrin-3B C(17)-methyltransferase [Eubacterium sp.]|nr:precorrin-3B C(17)-methyltransferase [Eubacterium sp.]
MNKVYAVGLGPGGEEYFTGQARAAIEKSDVICGYTVYVDLVRDAFPDKEFFTTSMKQEIDRCRKALEIAETGKTVAMVCSGDSGVYGMAGLLIQLAPRYKDIDVEVVCGVTAALSGSAVLGAPLGHDFCVISLSDLLTPWEVIEKRLRCAGEADFLIALYNPRSHKRVEHLNKACDILMENKSPDTVCGYVKNIGREGEEKHIVLLKDLASEPVDMFTTVFIGNKETKIYGDYIVTPRGYEKRDEL